MFFHNILQADVIITFEISELSKAEVLDPSWTDPQLLCSRKGASVKGGIGPFGLLVLASKGLQEYTAVFYRIFKSHNKYVVLMCSDQSRSLSLSLLPNFKLFFFNSFFWFLWGVNCWQIFLQSWKWWDHIWGFCRCGPRSWEAVTQKLGELLYIKPKKTL